MKPTLFDYRNEPDLSAARTAGFDLIVVSPRANETKRARCAALRAAGLLAFWVQPFVAMWKGKPVTGFEYDKTLWEAVKAGGLHLVKDKDDKPVSIEGDDITGNYIMDLRNHNLGIHWGDTLMVLDAPILFDYGTFDLSWEISIDTLPEYWPAWGKNYANVKLGVDSHQGAWVQTQETELPMAQAFEKLGRLVTPQALYWRSVVVDRPPIIFQDGYQDNDTKIALAHILGAYVGAIRDFNKEWVKTQSLGRQLRKPMMDSNGIVSAFFFDGTVEFNPWKDVRSPVARQGVKGPELAGGEGRVTLR